MNAISAVFLATSPVFAYLGIVLSIVVIARGLFGYRRAQRGGRGVGWVLIVFGLAMLVYFIVRIWRG